MSESRPNMAQPSKAGNSRVASPLSAGTSSSQNPIENLLPKVQFGLFVIRRWGFVCLLVGILLGAGAAAIVWFTYVPEYRAEAWIRIEGRRPTIVSTPGGGEDPRNFVMTQIQVMRSSLVLGPLLKDPAVAQLKEVKEAKSAIDWLDEHLSVKNLGNSEFYLVQFDGPTPEAAASITNKIVDSYINTYSDQDSRGAQSLLLLLESELERRSKELEVLEANAWDLTKRVTGEEPELDGTGKATKFVIAPNKTSDEERLKTAELDRQMLELQLESAQTILKDGRFEVPREAVQEAVATHTSLKPLLTEIAQLESDLEQTVRVAVKGREDPDAKRLQTQLEQATKELEEAQSRLEADVVKQLEAKARREAQANIEQMSRQLAEKRRTEEFFRERVTKEIQSRANVSGLALELELTRSNLERKRELYDSISDRVVALQTEMRAPLRVASFQKAVPPVDPIEDLPYKKAIMAALAALAFPFGLEVVWEAVARRILESTQLEESTGLPVIGEIAALPARRSSSRGPSEQFVKHQQLYEESIDALRTSLSISEEMKDVSVLAVASAVSAEGKTTLASQLAVSLARASGSPTLLIDGDMRAPDVHTIFDAPNDLGLADVLDGKSSVDEAIVKDWHEHLHVLPAGKLTRSPYMLLGQGHLESVLSEIRDRYRYIVIDAPPILSASEALIIAKAADGTVLCTMKDRTRVPQLKLARQRLDSAGVRVLGAVLAGVPARSYAYKYGGYYYYGAHANGKNGHSNGNGKTNGQENGHERSRKAK